MSLLWYLNPNLSAADIAALEEQEAESRVRLLDNLLDKVRKERDERGREAAIDLAEKLLPLVLLPWTEIPAHVAGLLKRPRGSA